MNEPVNWAVDLALNSTNYATFTPVLTTVPSDPNTFICDVSFT